MQGEHEKPYDWPAVLQPVVDLAHEIDADPRARLIRNVIAGVAITGTLAAGMTHTSEHLNQPEEPTVANMACIAMLGCVELPDAAPTPRPKPSPTHTDLPKTRHETVHPKPKVTPKPAEIHKTKKATLALRVLGPTLLDFKQGTVGVDVSWPNCGVPIRPDAQFGIVGVTHRGHPSGINQCLKEEADRVKNLGLYVNPNLDYKKAKAQNSSTTPCPLENRRLCASYRWGYRDGIKSVKAAEAVGVQTSEWHIDVETGNKWLKKETGPRDYAAQNSASILGEIDAIRKVVSEQQHIRPEQVFMTMYSTTLQWNKITGGLKLPTIPVWYATGGGISDAEAKAFCHKPWATNFTGFIGPNPVIMVQTGNTDKSFPHSQDINFRC